MPPTTPPDFSFDATAKAISSGADLQRYEFIDFTYGGKRFFGARLTLSSDESDSSVEYDKRAKPLMSTIEKGVAGSHPKLVCHGPTPTRVLRFESSSKKFVPEKG